MRLFTVLGILCSLLSTGFVFAQTQSEDIVDVINERLLEQGLATEDSLVAARRLSQSAIGLSANYGLPPGGMLPNYGLVVTDPNGEVIEVFGDLEYDVINGRVSIPGYETPEDSTISIVSQSAWAENWNEILAENPSHSGVYSTLGFGNFLQNVQSTSNDTGLSNALTPISEIPDAVFIATETLADQYCGNRARPSSISLSLVVSTDGSIFFISSGFQAGSEVTWVFEETCQNMGLE